MDRAVEEKGRSGPSPERLAEKHKQALFGDYFQLLELSRDADALSLVRAAASLLEEFDPDQGGQLSGEEQIKLRLVALVLREASGVLGDPVLRTRYSDHLRRGS